MKWPGPIVSARFLKRYKRFFADFETEDGRQLTAHCPNTGSMATCYLENAPCLLTHHDDPKRKLAYTWQAIEMPDGWTGINTNLANHLCREAIENGLVHQLGGYESIQREQKYGTNSRIDLLLNTSQGPSCYVEVKNVTLLLEPGVAAFPDAVTNRGTKHLHELTAILETGQRAVLFFCVQRDSVNEVRPAEAYDPEYARVLRNSVERGLEVFAYRAHFDSSGVSLDRELPVVL
ncbi:DNA/RNA nuclease SfsA [Sulfidibacter corallicola]|uniref:Sugar fermentation stimulation protein homolog n=1 Tax=Sulfidibacter corallicola TaxID=2818388 RepID=A0A8A4TVM0_SULCO|nr:DNA/RNA nuclease SfsA [Sulfidibacter corallicola]QTD53191.1 DNA/RNA nuclease SfsA [Sulfidibacter corallicola]